MTDDLRERVARAIANYHTIPWENMPEARKNRLLAYADAAIAEMDDHAQSELQAALAAEREASFREGMLAAGLSAVSGAGFMLILCAIF